MSTKVAERTKDLSKKFTELTAGHELGFNKQDWMFNQVIKRTKNFALYAIQDRIEPLYEVPTEKLLASWKHSSVARLYRVDNDENRLKELLELFKLRKSLNANDECPAIIKFNDQGFIWWDDKVYYAVRYEDPNRNFKHWVTVDHLGYNIDPFDCFRVAMNSLRSFIYLEKNGYVLTQFDDQNLFVGSFQEDRVNFCRIIFKGHKKTDGPFDLKKKNLYSAPEDTAADLAALYKSYVFSVGAMILWAILNTNSKQADYPNELHKNTDKIEGLIKTAADLLYKDSSQAENKELFKVFLEAALTAKAEDRPNAEKLFSFSWIDTYDKLDYIEFKKEEAECLKSFEKKDEEF